MKKIKRPATVIAIIHELKNIENAFEKFRQIVSDCKGKTMYVEFRASKDHKRSYEKFVNYALDNGIPNVVGLESKKISWISTLMWTPVPYEWKKVGKHAKNWHIE